MEERQRIIERGGIYRRNAHKHRAYRPHAYGRKRHMPYGADEGRGKETHFRGNRQGQRRDNSQRASSKVRDKHREVHAESGREEDGSTHLRCVCADTHNS